MFALPGLVSLVLVDYLRPQEFIPSLSAVPLLQGAVLLTAAGFFLDLRLGISRLRAAPYLLLAVFYYLWCLVSLAVRAPALLLGGAVRLLVPVVICLLLSHAIQSFRMLQLFAGVLIAIGLALSAVGIHQAAAPYGCHRMVGANPRDRVFVHDGRPCEIASDCWPDSEPGFRYRCERVGLLGTSSISGRVRYLGTLEDPNELAMVIAIVFPFAFAFYDRRSSLGRLLLVAVSIVVIGTCIYFTKSRGGQLVVLAVLGVYFVRRVGPWRGLATGVVLAAPILLFGGRGGASAATSVMERIEAWWVGLHLLTTWPGFGVGPGLFAEHHHMTAHSTFVLACAELGLPGLFLWTSIVYVATKIPIKALQAHSEPMVRAWAVALLASLAGLFMGSMFLSFLYKNVFWMYLGLSGVLYQAIKRHDPGFEVGFGVRDLLFVAAIDVSLLVAHVGYTGSKLGW